MKKSILALTLVAALSMLGACSSDDNGGSTGISGNFAKEPIKDAKLQLWNLNELNVPGKLPAGEATTLTDGSFNFPNADPAKAYVVKIAPNGLVGAKLMNVAGGVDLLTNLPDGLSADSAIIVPAGTNALLNPIGIAATVATGIDLTAAIPADEIAGAGALVNSSIDIIVTNLSELVLAAKDNGQTVSREELLNATWSSNLELALQLAKNTAGASITDLAKPAYVLSSQIISDAKDALPAAEAAANVAAGATGKPEVELKPVSSTEIIRTYLFSTNSTSAIFPAQLNATNATAYTVNASVYGATAAQNLLIAKGDLKLPAGKAQLHPAKSIDTVTIEPTNEGISIVTGKDALKAPAFTYDITKDANGTYSTIVSATFANGTSTTNNLVFNLGAGEGYTTNSSFFGQK